MLGDGCIYTSGSGLCISGHKYLDEKYLLEHVSMIIKTLYAVKPKAYLSSKKKEARVIVYSKTITKSLKEIGFPFGKKMKSRIRLPLVFREQAELQLCLMKGLFDTEGSIYPHNTAKVILEISNKHKDILRICKDINKQMTLGLNFTKDRAYLSGKKAVEAFIAKVGTSNPKHQYKLIMLQKIGNVPTSNCTESYLKENAQKPTKEGQ